MCVYYARRWRNTGTGSTIAFTDASSLLPSTLPGLFYSSADWADYNQDGTPDLAVIGQVDRNAGSARKTYVLKNSADKFEDVTAALLFFQPSIAKVCVCVFVCARLCVCVYNILCVCSYVCVCACVLCGGGCAAQSIALRLCF